MFYQPLFNQPQTQVIVISEARYAELQAEQLKRQVVVLESELNRLSACRLELEETKEKLQSQIAELLGKADDTKG